MQRFKKVLFIADGRSGEKNVLTRAINLAEQNKAKLTLFDALNLEVPSAVDTRTKRSIHDLQKTLIDNRRYELESMRESIVARHPGLRLAVEVDRGTTAVAIIRSILRNQHDLVIKAAERPKWQPSGLFGSTDLKLMRKCPCPVWIAKPSRSSSYRKILAAVDINPTEPEAEQLARQIMAISTSLAKREKSDLHVVHAWRLAGEATIRGRQVSTRNVDKLLREIRSAHRKELNALLENYPYARRIVHLLKGQAEKVIPLLVEKLNVDLIVIGTVGRTGIPGLLIGNTAEKILNTVNCSVLTLKPEGFETPIKV